MKSIVERFKLIQFGICFFIKDTDKHYLAYPFNAYVFPEEGEGVQGNITIDTETACFHRQQNLDFNKWVYEGIPYLNEKSETILKNRLMDAKKDEKEDLILTEEEKKRTDLILENVKKWIQDGAKLEYKIEDLNSFLRKFMYQRLEELYPKLYIETRLKGKLDKDIILQSLPEEEKKSKKDAQTKEGLKEINRKVGARKLLMMLKAAKFPIVGHNPIFDVLFSFSHFKNELPKDYPEFKQQIHEFFPVY
jgi:hypothetical protein